MTMLGYPGRASNDASLRSALRWERRVQMGAHPLAYPFGLMVKRLGPAVHVPGIGHVVSDPTIARAVLIDNEAFTKNGPGSAGELVTQAMGDYALLNLEGDAHHDLRAILVGMLNPSAGRHLVHEVWTSRLDETVCALRAGRSVDLAQLAVVLTVQTMRRLFGIAESDDRASLAMFRLGEKMVSVVRLRNGPLGRRVAARSRARFMALTEEIAAAMSSAPGSSIIGRLRADGCSESQIRGVAAALFLTGTGTVSTALPRMVALVSDANVWARLDERSARLAMVDECLRLITPSPVMLRSVRRDTVIGNHHFRAGRRVAILTYLAVRAFEDGDMLRPGRDLPPAVRQLHFGAGIHQCIGYGLARAELELSLERLMEAGPLRVRRRAVAHRVLIPRYRVLEIERAS